MKNSSPLLRGRQTAEEILEPTPMTKLRRRVFKNHSFLIGAVILVFIILYISIANFYLPKIKDNLDNRENKIKSDLDDANKFKELSEHG